MYIYIYIYIYICIYIYNLRHENDLTPSQIVYIYNSMNIYLYI